MIYFLGDVHGQIDHILRKFDQRAAVRHDHCSLIFLGDIEAPRPFEEMIRPLLDAGNNVWFIHGNNDTTHSRNWENLQDSQHRNLHARIETIEGLKIAGLGGVFRGEVWYPGMKCDEASRQFKPPAPKNFNSYEEYVAQSRNGRFRSEALLEHKLLKHRSTIFPNDFEILSQQKADILITHEAPDGHPHGFSELGWLALKMGITHYFHGHHHDSLDYSEWRNKTGIALFGVGFRGITNMKGEVIASGESDDDHRRDKYEQYKSIHSIVK